MDWLGLIGLHCIGWMGLIGLYRLYGMDTVCEAWQYDRNRKTVMGISDWIILGNWIGWISVGGRALVDCVFGFIVCVNTGSGFVMEVRVLVVYNMWFGRHESILLI